MAVVVQCYHCANVLELDDGFRGGVCRCSQCGALLQVPKESGAQAKQARPAAPNATPGRPPRPGTPSDVGLSKGQFDPRSRTWGAGTGQSPVEPAAGSGTFARSPTQGVRINGATATAPARAKPSVDIGLSMARPAKAPRKNSAVLYTIAGALIVIVLGLVVGVIYVIGDHTKPAGVALETSPEVVVNDLNKLPPPIKGPSFLGVPLVGKKIVFSLDDANSNSDSFDWIRRGVELAVASMAPDQRFKIALWKEDGLKVLPDNGWDSKGSHPSLDVLKEEQPIGSSEVESSLRDSTKLGADQIIFVTAKPDLQPEQAGSALAAKSGGVRMDAIKISGVDKDSPLKKLADATGGNLLQMDQDRLEAMVAATESHH